MILRSENKPKHDNSAMLKLGYMLLLIPHLKPGSLEHLAPMLEQLFDIMRAASTAVIFAMYLLRILKRDKPSGIIVGISLYELTLFLSTLYNHGDYWRFLIQAGSIISICMLAELMLKKNPLLCFDVMIPALELLVYLNFILILLFPGGMYVSEIGYWQNWLLGYDNMNICTILPAFMLSLLKDNYRTGKTRLSFRTLLLLFAGYASIIITWPATAVVGLLVLAVFLLMPSVFKATGIFNSLNYLIINLIFFFGVILLRQQHIFAGFIEGFLGKSITFTGRSYVWDASLVYIAQNPILGAGTESSATVMSKIGASHSHNQYLWDMYRGGIVHFSCFISIIWMTTSKLMNHRMDRLAQIIAINVFIVLFMLQIEAYSTHMLTLIYIFACHADHIIISRDAYLSQKAETAARPLMSSGNALRGRGAF